MQILFPANPFALKRGLPPGIAVPHSLTPAGSGGRHDRPRLRRGCWKNSGLESRRDGSRALPPLDSAGDCPSRPAAGTFPGGSRPEFSAPSLPMPASPLAISLFGARRDYGVGDWLLDSFRAACSPPLSTSRRSWSIPSGGKSEPAVEPRGGHQDSPPGKIVQI